MLQRLASRYLLPLVGSTKPPRRTNRAFPDDAQGSRRPSARSAALSGGNTEVVTTAPSAPSSSAEDRGAGATAGRLADAATGAGLPNPSVMREWVDELTGRTERAAAGLRVPSEAEITQLTSMFPDLRREAIVGALQRRYGTVPASLCLLRCRTEMHHNSSSPNIEAAVDTLLSTQS